MRVLLDTNVLLWWLAADPVLSVTAKRVISHGSNTIYVSAASAWEICTKVRIGKLPSGRDLCDDFLGYLDRHKFQQLAISIEHARLAGRIAGTHKDPFDRIIAAQAMIENVPVVTNDAAIDGFGAKVVW